MRTFQLASTDLHPSRLALGTMHLGQTWDREPVTADAIKAGCTLLEEAVELGINHLDLADIYTFGKSEEVVGAFLKSRPELRDGLILEAKCGIILDSPKRYDSSTEHIVRAVEGTLTRLGTDRVELLAIHRPDPLAHPEEIAEAFTRLREAGKVLHFGVSNHSAHQVRRLQAALEVPLVLNQLELSLVHHSLISEGLFVNQETRPGEGLIEFSQQQSMTIQAWSPVAGGRVFEGSLGELLKQMAVTEYDCPPEAMALAWLLRHPAGIQPVVGTSSVERLRRFARAPEVELSRPDWYRLLEAALGAPVP